MNALRRVFARLVEFRRSRAVDADMTAEVQSHIDHLADEYAAG